MERVQAAMARGIANRGHLHALSEAVVRLSAASLALGRVVQAMADDDPARASVLAEEARGDAAGAILAMGSVRAILGSSVDDQVLEELERYELLERVFEHGRDNCLQSAMENAPFADVGGLERRSSFRAPRWFREQYPGDDGRLLRAYFAGYRAAARGMYGSDWRTCEFGWNPAIRIEGQGFVGASGGEQEPGARSPRVWMPSWHDLELPTTASTGSGRCVRLGERPSEPCPEGGEWVEIPPERVPRWVREGIA